MFKFLLSQFLSLPTIFSFSSNISFSLSLPVFFSFSGISLLFHRFENSIHLNPLLIHIFSSCSNFILDQIWGRTKCKFLSLILFLSFTLFLSFFPFLFHSLSLSSFPSHSLSLILSLSLSLSFSLQKCSILELENVYVLPLLVFE